MAEGERPTISRLIGYTPEADEALRNAAEAMGISVAEAANNAAIVYDQVVHAGMGPGRTLLIFNDKTREIEGGVRIHTKLIMTDEDSEATKITPFDSASDSGTPEVS